MEQAVVIPDLRPSAVARLYGVAIRTVHNWMSVGVETPGGVRVRLKYKPVGGTNRTTLEWVEEFNRARGGSHEPVALSPAKQQAQARREQAATAKLLGPGRKRPR